jgi:polysaccharide pyruvyl transferase WcaK-like protein
MGTRRILIVADAGGRDSGDRWHVGDEAMLAASIDWLRSAASTIDIVVASTSPAWTHRMYDVAAVPCLDFGDNTDTAAARDLYRSVVASLGRATTGDSESDRATAEFVAALHDVDAVFFCGAGNLCSAFPNRLYERLAIAGLARGLGQPYAFGAQTLGPRWDTIDKNEVALALADAELVGTRDRRSAEMAKDLGVTATPMADDALCLTTPAFTSERAGPIGVTLHRSPLEHRRYDPAVLAHLLDHLAETTGSHLRFIPHFRGPQDRWSDERAADELRIHLRTPLAVTPWCEPAEVIRMTAACRLVLSTRYHPLVFALGSGVPALGLHQDDYHLAKMEGILQLFRRRSWLYPANLPNGVSPLVDIATALLREPAATAERVTSARTRSEVLAMDRAARSALLDRLMCA